MYLFFGIFLSNCNLTSSYRSDTDIITQIDPFIGTADGGGACFVGACLPFGLVRLGPDTPLSQNTSGYVAHRSIMALVTRMSMELVDQGNMVIVW